MSENLLETSKGVELKVSGLSPFAPKVYGEEFAEKHPEPKAPTYKAITVGGDVEVHEYDFKSLPQPDQPEPVRNDFGNDAEFKIEHERWAEEKDVLVAWDLYVAKHDLWQAEQNQYLMDQLFLEGVTSNTESENNKPIYDKWVKRTLKRRGSLPEDEDELLLLWLKTGAIGGADDIEKIMAALMASAGASNGAVKAVKETFRR